MLIKYAAAISLPLSILASGILFFFYYEKAEVDRTGLETNELLGVHLRTNLLSAEFRFIASDLKYLANQSGLKQLFEGNESARQKYLAQSHLIFSKEKRVYDQVRYLDQNGMEVVRTYFNNGNPQTVSEEDLQAKGERYYFKNTYALEKGQIYVSPFDLNMEHGAIDEPLQPTIRFGTPVFDHYDQKRGVLILNYLAVDLLRVLEEVIPDNPISGQSMLLNSDGFWLVGTTPEDEWGFMYKGGQDRTFANRFPDAWQQILGNESGQFQNTEGIFSFATVYPYRQIQRSNIDSRRMNAPGSATTEDGALYWKVVSYLPAEVLNAQSYERWSSFSLLCIASIVLIGVGSWFTSHGILRRRQIEESLRASEERFRSIMDNLVDGVITIDERGEILSVNPAVETLFQYSAGELVGRTVNYLMPEPYHSEHDDYVARYLRTGEKQIIGIGREVLGQRKDGEVFPIDLAVCEFTQGGERFFAGIIRDITERKQTEQNLVASEKQHRRLFEDAPMMYVLTENRESNPIITDANAQFLNTLGYTYHEVVGQPAIEFYTPASNAQMLEGGYQRAMEGRFLQQERQLVARDGRVIETLLYALPEFDSNNNVIGTRAIYVDITDRKSLEEEHRKNQNLEALGVLAGGIAHDFNNVLTAVIGSFELLEMYTDTDSDIHQIILDGKRASDRTRSLTQQLLTFAKGGAPIKEAASIESLIRETTELSLRGSNTKPEFHLDEDLYSVNMDQGQISQVLQNLVLNAGQAMPDGGVLKVSAGNIELVSQDSLPLEAGSYVKVSVVDQGSGIPTEIIAKIFDPYFSTKAAGHGLGLSIVYSIIQRHEGHITVHSEENIGTTFEFYLPAVQEHLASTTDSDQKLMGGTGRILLMDDEEMIHTVVTMMLEKMGYQVESAYEGDQALQAYQAAMESEHPFDLVIMDLTVPGGMGGQQAVEKLHEIDPNARVIVSSGYANNPIMTRFSEYGFIGAVKKPVDIRELAEVVKKGLVNGE